MLTWEVDLWANSERSVNVALLSIQPLNIGLDQLSNLMVLHFLNLNDVLHEHKLKAEGL